MTILFLIITCGICVILAVQLWRVYRTLRWAMRLNDELKATLECCNAGKHSARHYLSEFDPYHCYYRDQWKTLKKELAAYDKEAVRQLIEED